MTYSKVKFVSLNKAEGNVPLKLLFDKSLSLYQRQKIYQHQPPEDLVTSLASVKAKMKIMKQKCTKINA
jgi:hypothetical protein